MSTFWQWVFSIVGVVAFMMSFPFFFTLLFGKPKIGYSFRNDDTNKDGRLIRMHLMNRPVSNPLIKMLLVSRMVAQDVYLCVEVFDNATKHPIYEPYSPEICLSNTNKGMRVSIPPSMLMTNITIAKWDRVEKSAILLCGTELIPLLPGDYLMKFKIGVDGKTFTFKKLGLLHVGKTENELMWDEAIVKRLYLQGMNI
jgi:hypothetical protein